jgi:transcription elongation factor GreB
MSRAFLEESDDDFSGEDVPALLDPLPPGVKNYMTPEGAARLEDELHRLTTVEVPALSAELRGGADRSREEVAGDRRRLREMERRIEYLQSMIGRLEVVYPSPENTGQVVFGTRVTVDEGDGEQKSYTIVGVDESDPAAGRISWISPLARALLSKRVGDTVRLDLPGGAKTISITGIRIGNGA